jgi:hypothetical protein
MQLQHARAHSTRKRLATITEGVSGARPHDRWRSPARTPALNRTNKWRSKLQILNAALDIHAEDTAFGYRFIADELPKKGITAGENRVQRVS